MLNRISVLVSDAVLKRIDKARGITPKSRFVAQLLEEALEIPAKERKQYE